MASGSTFTVTSSPSFRGKLGRYEKANKELVEGKRDMMRDLGRRMVVLMKDEAPQGKTGKFKAGIRFRTHASGDTVGFKVTVPEPLHTFIVKGTKPHKIMAKRAGALYFFFGKIGMFTVVPKGGGFKTHVRGGKLWVGKGYVSHPGTKANDYQERALNRFAPEYKAGLNRISSRWVDTVTS